MRDQANGNGTLVARLHPNTLSELHFYCHNNQFWETIVVKSLSWEFANLPLTFVLSPDYASLLVGARR